MAGDKVHRSPAGERPAARRDAVASSAAAALFSLGLALAAVAIPLVAVRAGYAMGAVGVFVALSAISQLVTRLFMGAMMRRFPDKYFVVLAGIFLALSCVLIAFSTTWYVIVLSQLLQGVARALFWTGTQTHAVRMSSSAVGALALVNLASGVGLIGGPVLAGLLLQVSNVLTLGVAGAVGAGCLVPSLMLVRLPPFPPREQGGNRTRIWRRPGVSTACWAGGTAGAWRAVLNSYIPVVLDQARQSTSAIGVLVALANAGSIVGGAAAGWLRERGMRSALVLGVLSTGLGVSVAGVVAGEAVVAAVALVVSGLGAGVLQTVGPAVATDAVGSEERGEAIATAGTFRAAALFVAPFGIAGLVGLMPLAVAMAVAGSVMVLPVLTVRKLGRNSA